jgi:hypothetical protein
MEILKRVLARIGSKPGGTNFRPMVHTVWTVEKRKKGTDELVDRTVDHNVVTGEGLDALLNIMFHNGTQINPWYIIVFENDFTPDGDETYAVPGYTETNAKVDETLREEYVEGASSGGVISNSASKARYTFNNAVTIYGGALVGGGTDGNTQGDTAGGGTLFAAAHFAAHKVMADDEYLDIQVDITATSV